MLSTKYDFPFLKNTVRFRAPNLKKASHVGGPGRVMEPRGRKQNFVSAVHQLGSTCR